MSKAYVVCQTPKCQQTYPLSYFGEITKDTKNIDCEKCGGVLVDNNGRANFSQHPDVSPGISVEEYENTIRINLDEKRAEREQLNNEIKELEEELVANVQFGVAVR